jgi:L-serine dehydratase
MDLSLFDIFKIGIGPSSSHTVGPMLAARRFAGRIVQSKRGINTARVTVELFGSLALTGRGHGTDRAVLLGLAGEQPDVVDPSEVEGKIRAIQTQESLSLLGKHPIRFQGQDIVFHGDAVLPGHPNGMRFTALDNRGCVLDSRTYYSVGGGFITEEGEEQALPLRAPIPHPFESAADLLHIGQGQDLPVHLIVLQNELAWRDIREIRSGIWKIWDVMQDCTLCGLRTSGLLPGELKVRRRAAVRAKHLQDKKEIYSEDGMDWLSIWAMAVNEENAAGGRVVTAPTNGAAGIVPAVLHYYWRFQKGTEEGLYRFFLTASAVATLYKKNGSISAAEVGCQGEVGVASSMAAAGLVSALEGTNEQIEHAAEIAMEHHLGLTCDPVAGLVQVPCIERNAFGAVHAVNAARMAMQETEGHRVHLDQVIAAMLETGRGMETRFKETSKGGLALSVIEC